MSGWLELYPDAMDPMGLNIGGDEFPRRHSNRSKPVSAEQRASLDKVAADYIAQAGWDNPPKKLKYPQQAAPVVTVEGVADALCGALLAPYQNAAE